MIYQFVHREAISISKFDERHKMTTFINNKGYRYNILIRVIEKKRTFGLSKRRRTKKETRQTFGEGKIFGK